MLLSVTNFVTSKTPVKSGFQALFYKKVTKFTKNLKEKKFKKEKHLFLSPAALIYILFFYIIVFGCYLLLFSEKAVGSPVNTPFRR